MSAVRRLLESWTGRTCPSSFSAREVVGSSMCVDEVAEEFSRLRDILYLDVEEQKKLACMQQKKAMTDADKYRMLCCLVILEDAGYWNDD